MAELSYQFDYAATSRGKCHKCKKGMTQGELYIGKEVKSGFHDSIDVQKHHFDCICETPAYKKTDLSKTKGWKRLRWEDQQKVRESLNDDCPIDEKKAEKLEELNNKFWEARDKLEAVQSKITKELLAENGKTFDGKVSTSDVLDAVADLMAFGRIMACPKCHQDALINKHHYVYCNGNVTDYEKCEHKIENYDEVKRYAVSIPDKIKAADKKGVLKGWKFDDDFPTEKWRNEGGEDENKMEEEDNREEDEIEDTLVLRGMKIIIVGSEKNLDGTLAEYNDLIRQHGGEIAKNPMEATVCVSTDEDMKKARTAKMKEAKESLTVLNIEWLTTLIMKEEGFMKLRKKEGAEQFLCEGCEWKTEIVGKKYHKDTAKVIVKNTFKPIEGCALLKLHDLNNIGSGWQVLVENDPVYGYTAYNVTLVKVDISTGRNSSYQIQIAHNKTKTKFHMIMEWGRVGEKTNNTDRSGSLEDLKEEFIKKFKDCTGNDWENRNNFKRVPGRYSMIELDDGRDEEEAKKEIQKEVKKEVNKENYLDERVSSLIEMIFDTNMMKQTLQTAGLNLEKMPLGKIKISQMKEALRVLSSLGQLLSKECELDEETKNRKIKANTTQYYELVPHIMSKIELIDNDEKLKKELSLVETMCDVGEAMELMKTDVGSDAMDQIYANYQKLNTKITAMDKESERYKLLVEFFTNNQQKGHYRGKVVVKDIYEIEREGERERYKPHENDENRQLLYHGSRLTNFVGILSTGLRIAPPEAPANGYRFGKGLYFANCASKSVSYCTYNDKQQGCMLFCEVALGKPWETLRDKYMEKPQPGFDSTYALGQVEPEKSGVVELEDGVKVNKGEIVTVPGRESSWCSHSELIVYDVARVNIRYMVVFELPH